MASDADRDNFLIALTNLALDAYPGKVWFAVDQDSRNKERGSGIICEYLEDGMPFHRVSAATIRTGMKVIRGSAMGVWQYPNTETVVDAIVNKDGQRLFMTEQRQDRILQANTDNDITDLHQDDALAVLECGLFGQVTYQ